METINQILSALDQLQGLSAVAVVALTCIVAGYVWRFLHFKWFPNEAIPVFVILWGAFAMSVIADAKPGAVPFRIWFFRNVFIGLIIGFLAWLAHAFIIKRIEDWILSKFPGLSDTTFFAKNASSQSNQTNNDQKP